jgi:hypothetical protein
MDDFLFEEMLNDFQEYDNIPLACNSLPNKSDSTAAYSITTASDSPLNTNSISMFSIMSGDRYIVYKICDVVWKIYLRGKKSRRQI